MNSPYTWSTPNGRKAPMLLEEPGAAHDLHPVDIPKLSDSLANRPALHDGLERIGNCAAVARGTRGPGG